MHDTFSDFKTALRHYQDYRIAQQYEREAKYYRVHHRLPCDAQYTRLVKTPDGKVVLQPK